MESPSHNKGRSDGATQHPQSWSPKGKGKKSGKYNGGGAGGYPFDGNSDPWAWKSTQYGSAQNYGWHQNDHWQDWHTGWDHWLQAPKTGSSGKGPKGNGSGKKGSEINNSKSRPEPVVRPTQANGSGSQPTQKNTQCGQCLPGKAAIRPESDTVSETGDGQGGNSQDNGNGSQPRQQNNGQGEVSSSCPSANTVVNCSADTDDASQALSRPGRSSTVNEEFNFQFLEFNAKPTRRSVV